MDVNVALRTRISTRAFLPTPVSKELLTAVLDDARWSPSGGNLQPWKVVAVAGDARQAVIDAVNAAAAADPSSQEGEHPMYPAELWEPLRTRRYQVGVQMYAQLAIPRDDKTARFARIMENFNFFGAPVGLFFVTDDRMGAGQWTKGAHVGTEICARPQVLRPPFPVARLQDSADADRNSAAAAQLLQLALLSAQRSVWQLV